MSSKNTVRKGMTHTKFGLTFKWILTIKHKDKNQPDAIKVTGRNCE